jgi:hypothetical protein
VGWWFHGVALAAGLAALLASAAAYTPVKLAGAGYLLYCSDWSSGGLSAPLPPETHQIRSLVLNVHTVRPSAVCAAQVRGRIHPGRRSPAWCWLVLMTPGLTQRRHRRQAHQTSRHALRRLLGGCADDSELIAALLAELGAFTGAGWEQDDDITAATRRAVGRRGARAGRAGAGRSLGS